MAKRVAQSEIIGMFGQRPWRALLHMLLLLLLFAHQTWAGDLCHCDRQEDAKHAGCHVTQSPARALLEAEEADSTHHCSEVEAPDTKSQIGTTPQTAMTCCDLTTEAKEQAVPVSSQNQESSISAPLPVQFGAQSAIAPAPSTLHYPPQTRPLYLAYSCLLI